jgi:hypothetical protein
VVPGAMNSVSKIPLWLFEWVHQSQLCVILDHVCHVHQCTHPWSSAPFSHTTVTYNIITVYTTQSVMIVDRAALLHEENKSQNVQLAAVVMRVTMFHQRLLLHYALKVYEGRHSAIINVTCYYWACALALWHCVSFYQPIGGWFRNCPCTVL